MNLETHTAIPFTLAPTNHFLIEGKFNDTFARFILDSGAGRCCMGLQKANEMNLIMAESEHTAAGVGDGYMDRFEVAVPHLAIGNWQVENFAVAALDLSGVNRALEGIGEASVAGIIGADILLQFEAILNYQTLNLKLADSDYTPFECIRSNHAVIEVQLKNAPQGDSDKTRFIIDTGAGQTCIDLQLVENYGWTLKEIEEKATGIGSSSMPISTTTIPKVCFGDYDLFDYQMTIIDLGHVNQAFADMNVQPVDGIIGADVLLQYRGVIDCKGKKLLMV